MGRDPLDDISEMRLHRDGTISVSFADGRSFDGTLGHDAFTPSSAIEYSRFLPQSFQLELVTTRGDSIVVDLARTADLAPIRGRPTIYLDQNHWSTLTAAIHEPGRIRDRAEGTAASHLVELARRGRVVLPMSSGHALETSKQADATQRYRRAVTVVQLSGGWQLRDPLDVRRFELRQVLSARYRLEYLPPQAVVTLEPGAAHAGSESNLPPVGEGMDVETQWALHAIRCIGGLVDALLDASPVQVGAIAGWTNDLQRFTDFLRDNPTEKELKRRRTHAKFVADLGRELAEEAHHSRITPDEMSDWTIRHSESDLCDMPALGLFREVLHEKLSDRQLRWADNDLIDMMYLTTAAGYCDHVVAERAHGSYIRNGLRRMGRPCNVYRNIRSLIDGLRAKQVTGVAEV